MIWPGLTERLEGRRVVLEPLVEAHREGLLEAARAPEIWTWVDGEMAEAPDDRFPVLFEEALAEAARGEAGPFATLDVEDGRPIGSTRFLTLRPRNRGLEIGSTWLHPSAWGTGANAEAKLLMLAHAFERLGCVRVEFQTDVRNDRCRAALAALPARFEGVLRKHRIRPGIPGANDSALFSVIDDDWPEVRSELERRLARAPEAASHA